MALDSLVMELDEEGQASIFNLICDLRHQRNFLVQSLVSHESAEHDRGQVVVLDKGKATKLHKQVSIVDILTSGCVAFVYSSGQL